MNPCLRNVATACCLAALLSGPHFACHMPVSSLIGGTENAVRKRVTPTRDKMRTGDTESSATSRLVIHGESVWAEEIWQQHYDELDAEAKTRTPSGFRDYVAKRAYELIRDYIAGILLAKQASLRVTPDIEQRIDSYVDGEIRKIVTTDHGGRQRRYEKYLESSGKTLANTRARIRRELLIASYLEQHIRPMILQPTRAELYAEFEASLESLRRPPRRRMSLIEIRITDRLPHGANRPTRDQLSKARQKALASIRAAYGELASGSDFAPLARRYSDGLHVPEGGAWGWITQGSVRQRFEPAVNALFELDENTVSEIIEGGNSFFLVRCDEIDDTVTPNFQSHQPELKDRVFREQYNRLVMGHVEELRDNAGIDQDDLDRFFIAVVEDAVRRQNLDAS